MFLMEYQAKEIIRRSGLAVPEGIVADAPEKARRAAREIGPCMVKAQVRGGGRGKAGLIRPASTPSEAESAAAKILGSVHRGERVDRVLVEERLEIKDELFLGVVLDTSENAPAALLSTRGGVDVERVAQKDSGALVRLKLDPLKRGIDRELWGRSWRKAGLSEEMLPRVVSFSAVLLEQFYANDAYTLEINPLAVTRDGSLVAADCRLIVDDAALFRHPELHPYRPARGESPEGRAEAIGVTYVPLDESGAIGVMAGGAGLSMATMDEVADAGEVPAAFLDLGGGISEENMAEAIRIMLSTKGLRGLIINVFGGINNCGVMAGGVRRVWSDIRGKIELVVKMRGHSQEAGWQILEELNIPLVKYGTTTEAVGLLMDRVAGAKER